MDTFLKIDNNYSTLITPNQYVKEILWKLLRFRARGYFHNSRYKMKLWDGFVEFFKKDSGRFLTGLLPEIVVALNKTNTEHKIVDLRNKLDFMLKEVDKSFLNPVELYDYQVDFINQIIKHKRGVIQAPTSSGKTNVLVGILKALPPNTPTLILGNRTSLAEQNYDEIKKWGFENVGRLYEKNRSPDVITCANVQSCHLISSWLPKFEALIVDEIHEMMSKKPKTVYRGLKSASIRVALSATPFKWGGKDQCQKYEVKGWFGPVIRTNTTDSGKLTTKELQKRDILSTASCYFYPILEPNLPYEIYLDAVTKGVAENEHFHSLVSKLIGKLRGRTLILVERIAHGDMLQERIPGALWVRGQDTVETRKNIIKKLKLGKGKIVAIATQGIFNTGIDVYVHNLVNCAGQKAEHLIVQRMGRGLRRASDKRHLQYYDFIFKINEYLYKHSIERVRVLQREGHEVTMLDRNFL